MKTKNIIIFQRNIFFHWMVEVWAVNADGNPCCLHDTGIGRTRFHAFLNLVKRLLRRRNLTQLFRIRHIRTHHT